MLIIPDNDKAGKEFANKIANSLVDHANTVKVLDLTKIWPDLKEKGDITDVFEMVNNDEEVIAKLNELEQQNNKEEFQAPEIKKVEKKKEKIFEIEELNLKFYIPYGYDISKEKGIFMQEQKKEITIPKIISPIPILITKILKDVDSNNEKVELIFYKNNQWENVIIDKNVLYNINKLIDLANRGLYINSINVRNYIKWFANLEMKNHDKKTILEGRVIDRMGWVDNKIFIPYVNNDVKIEIEEGIGSWIKGIGKEKGTLEEWINIAKKVRENNVVRFFLSCRLYFMFTWVN